MVPGIGVDMLVGVNVIVLAVVITALEFIVSASLAGSVPFS